MKFPSFSRLFSEENYAKFVDLVNTAMAKKLSVDDNLATQAVTITNIGAGVEFSVPHSFKAIPKYRTIMRQRGGGLVTDGDTAWTENVIYLKNTGSTTIETVTIVIWRN